MTDCACSTCLAACRQTPGWFTPDEAMNAVEAGHARRIEAGITDDGVMVLAPKAERDPMHPLYGYTNYVGTCAFLNAEGRCELHDTAFKPTECRNTMPCRRQGGLRRELEHQWNTRLGALAVRKWYEATV